MKNENSMFQCSNVQMFKSSGNFGGAKTSNESNVQMFQCSNVQMFKSSGNFGGAKTSNELQEVDLLSLSS